MKKRLLCLCLAFSLLLGAFAMAPQTRAASSMKASDDCIALIKAFEGFSGTPYKDTDGKYTIGYGTRCPDELVAQYQETPMTEEEADAELRSVVVTYENAVNEMIDKHGLSYQQCQFDAVVSLVFNVGTSWLSKGNTLVKALTGGAVGNELIYAFSIYSMSGGSRSVGHVRRRLAEAATYLEGTYTRTAPDNYCFVLYDGQGGDVEEYDVQGYDGYLTASPIATATREGYLFKGWSTSPSGGSLITVLDMDTKSATLYAQWEVDPNGGTEPSDPSDPSDPTEPSEPSQSTEPSDPSEPTEPQIPEGDRIDPVVVRVTGSQVNVRKGPGLSYDVVDSLDKGDQITISATYESDGYLWGKCGLGWVALEHTDYFEEDEPTVPPTDPTEPTEPPTEPSTKPTEPSTKPTEPPTEPTDPPTEPTDPPTEPTTRPTGSTEPSTAPTEPEPEIPEGEPIEAVKVRVTVSRLNLRKGPGLDFDVVGGASRGESFTITAVYENDDYLWGKFDGGWLTLKHTDYAEVTAKPEAPAEPADPPTEPTEPSTEPTDPTTDPSDAPTDPSQPEMPPEGTKLYATVIGTQKLNVRQTPGGTVVGVLDMGDRVQILEQKIVDGVLWGRFELGWISMRTYVKLETVTEEPSDGPDEDLPQTGEDAPVVDEPSEGGKIYATVINTSAHMICDAPDGSVVAKLAPGEQVEILETTASNGVQWGRCAQGWIRIRSCLKLETVEKQAVAEQRPASITTYAVAEEGSVDVLTEPDGEVCGQLGAVERVQIIGYQIAESGLWGQCEAGWICLRDAVRLETFAELVSADDPSAAIENVTIRALRLNLRSEAGSSSPVVCHLYEGTTVAIREMKAADGTIWARTDLGWINMDNIA